MFHSVSLTWGRAQSLCSTSWNWRRCFPGYFPPTGRWAEKCSVKMKYQSCPHVIYNSSLQWELLLAVFFQVSQEIMTSFFLWTLVRKVWIEMVAGKARTRLSPNAVLLQHQLSALTQVSVPPGSLQTFLLYCAGHNRGWQQRCWRDGITCGIAFELEQNPQHTLACASVIRSTQRCIGLF